MWFIISPRRPCELAGVPRRARTRTCCTARGPPTSSSICSAGAPQMESVVAPGSCCGAAAGAKPGACSCCGGGGGDAWDLSALGDLGARTKAAGCGCGVAALAMPASRAADDSLVRSHASIRPVRACGVTYHRMTCALRCMRTACSSFDATPVHRFCGGCSCWLGRTRRRAPAGAPPTARAAAWTGMSSRPRCLRAQAARASLLLPWSPPQHHSPCLTLRCARRRHRAPRCCCSCAA